MSKDFDYKKSLGQNFLIDKNIVNKIINEIDSKESDLIIEIGPGNGAITKALSETLTDVYSFEIDKRLESELLKFENSSTHIIYEDFLKVDLNEFLKCKKYDRLYFIGNLPYYITTAIVNKIIDESDAYKIVIMIQKEVAQRYMAKPCTREYSSISVYLQYNFKIEKVCDVKRTSFYPSPKVDSVVLRFIRREKEKVNNIELFNRLIRDSFRLKRKNLRNNLGKYDLNTIENILKKKNKDLRCRAEELTVEDFIDISNELNKDV